MVPTSQQPSSSASSASGVLVDVPSDISSSREIPTTFRASLKSWWDTSETQSALAEERLFRRLPFFIPSQTASSKSKCKSEADLPSTPMSPITPSASSYGVTARVAPVPLPSNPKKYLNTFSIIPNSLLDPHATTVQEGEVTVMLPGYGAGIGFFFLNFTSLSKWVLGTSSRRKTTASTSTIPRRFFAVDWLGMGRSGRPTFPTIKHTKDNVQSRVSQAESFFLDSLEEWREAMGIQKMNLIGHSLGGYLSVAYALRHPERVSRLILLSPAGVPLDPNSLVGEQEFGETAPEGANATRSGSPVALARKPSRDEVEHQHKMAQEKQNQSTFRRFAMWAWEEGWSPFQIVRRLAFWGPMVVGKYSARRFAHLTEEEIRDMHDYIWHITAAKGSGEYCISHLLAPGAFARLPLVDRVHDLKIPVSFIYGDQDWMDPEGGRQAVENMEKAGNPDGRLYLVPGAGHHVYLDNPEATDQVILKELGRVPTNRGANA